MTKTTISDKLIDTSKNSNDFYNHVKNDKKKNKFNNNKSHEQVDLATVLLPRFSKNISLSKFIVYVLITFCSLLFFNLQITSQIPFFFFRRFTNLLILLQNCPSLVLPPMKYTVLTKLVQMFKQCHICCVSLMVTIVERCESMHQLNVYLKDMISTTQVYLFNVQSLFMLKEIIIYMKLSSSNAILILTSQKFLRQLR